MDFDEECNLPMCGCGRACSTLKLWALYRLLAAQGRWTCRCQQVRTKEKRGGRSSSVADAMAGETDQREKRRIRHRVDELGCRHWQARTREKRGKWKTPEGERVEHTVCHPAWVN